MAADGAKTHRFGLDLRFRRNLLAPTDRKAIKVGAMMTIFKEVIWADTLPELFDKMYEEG